MENKVHYKLHKVKKQWVTIAVASAALATVVGGLSATTSSVSADETQDKIVTQPNLDTTADLVTSTEATKEVDKRTNTKEADVLTPAKETNAVETATTTNTQATAEAATTATTSDVAVAAVPNKEAVVTTDAPEVEFILEYRSPFVTVFFPTENRAVEESFNFACASEHPAKTEKDRRDANNRFLVFFMLVSLTFCT